MYLYLLYLIPVFVAIPSGNWTLFWLSCLIMFCMTPATLVTAGKDILKILQFLKGSV